MLPPHCCRGSLCMTIAMIYFQAQTTKGLPIPFTGPCKDFEISFSVLTLANRDQISPANSTERAIHGAMGLLPRLCFCMSSVDQMAVEELVEDMVPSRVSSFGGKGDD